MVKRIPFQMTTENGPIQPQIKWIKSCGNGISSLTINVEVQRVGRRDEYTRAAKLWPNPSTHQAFKRKGRLKVAGGLVLVR